MIGTRVEVAVQRLKEVFLEPGTQITVSEAERLTGLEHHHCEMVLGALVDARYIRRGLDGMFVTARPDA